MKDIPIASGVANSSFSLLYNITLCDYPNLPINSTVNRHLNGAAMNLLVRVYRYTNVLILLGITQVETVDHKISGMFS